MRRLFLGILCIALAACGSDKTTGPDVDLSFVGNYSLSQMNGTNLPFVMLQSGQASISMTSDRLSIADGGTWSENGTTKTVENGQTSNDAWSDHGTWLRSGNNIVLSSSVNTNTDYRGTFSKDRLTLSDGAFTYLFVR